MPPVLLLAFAMCYGSMDTDSMEPIERIAARVLSARTNLTNGHCVFSIRTLQANQLIYERTHRRIEIWFDGENIRMDKKWSFPKGSRTDWRVLSDNRCIMSTGSERPIMDDSRRNRTPADVSIPHPRLVGLIPSRLMTLHRYDAGELFQRPDRQNIKMASATLNDIDTVLMEFDLQTGTNQWAHCRIWIAPTMGYNVLRIEIAEDNPDSGDRWFLDSELATYSANETWYPKRLHFKQFENGKLFHEEIVTVEEAEFNVKIDPTVFTVTGLPLSKDQEVLRDGYMMQVWDGRQLRPK